MSDELLHKLKKRVDMLAQALDDLNLRHEDKIRELSLVRKLGEHISYSIDLREASNRTLSLLIKEFSPENCSIFLSDNQSGKLNLYAVQNIYNDPPEERRLSPEHPRSINIGEGAAGWAAMQQQTVYIPDTHKDDRFIHFEHMRIEVGSIVCLPLLNHDNLEGVITLSHSRKNAFSPNIVHILDILRFDIGAAIGNIRLISDIKHNNDELKETNKSLHRTLLELYKTQQLIVDREKLSVISILAAGIAHEFNNIFAGIVGYSELGIMQNDTENYRKYASSILKLSERATAITKKLLDFSGRSEIRKSAFNLNTEIETILEMVMPELMHLNIVVHKQLESVPDIVGDAHKISQIVLHLIANARDSMNDGGILTIVTREADGMVACTITDTGTGIEPSVLRHIFDPFMTTKGALGGNIIPGTGLGLSIAYGVIKSHNGEIAISSELSKGTTVRFTLPHCTACLKLEELREKRQCQ